MKVLLVEPHPDDICLSFYFFLEDLKKKADVFLMSVFWDEDRDSRKFCDCVGIEYLFSDPLQEVLYENRINHGLIKRKADSYLYQRSYYLANYQEDFLEVEKILSEIFDGNSFDVVITCLGILHPWHVLVNYGVRRGFCGQGIFFYADFPYQTRRYGVYWYRAIKDHPDRGSVRFLGGYKEPSDIYKNAAFGVDLSYIQRGKFANGQRTQYTVIEAIEAGTIPVGFDVWRWEEGYDGVWLPSPVKVGNRLVFDERACVDKVRGAVYDYDMAVRNRQIVTELCDLERIGNIMKALFEGLG